MKKFSDRLKSLMESLEVSGYMIAKEIGVSDMSISKFRSEKGLPSFDFFEKLKARYPEVNLNWLIGNTGEMFLDPNIKIKPSKPKIHPPDLLDAKNEIISLQGKQIEMMEEKIQELNKELRTYRKAGELLKVVNEKKEKVVKPQKK
jgi:transcriptional regulator with XRE-family HTH domain